MEYIFEYADQEWGWDKEEAKQSIETVNEYIRWLSKMANKYGYFYPARGPEQYPEKCPIDI